MSNSLKERIIIALVAGVTFFLVSVTFILFDYKEDWFLCSLMGAISCSTAYFVSTTIAEARADESIIKLILYKALISFFVALVMSFITGVLISLSNWGYWVYNACVPFTVSLLVFNTWKKD